MSTSESNTPLLKTCTKCGSNLPATLEFWHRDAQKNDGLCFWCKVCKRADNARWAAENPERVKELSARWYVENLERAKESQARWRAKHPERAKEINAQWKAANPERVIENHARWYAENLEKEKARRARRYAADPEKAKEDALLWRSENLEKSRNYAALRYAENPEREKKLRAAASRRRKALKKGATGTHTAHDIRNLYWSQDGLCFWCDAELGDDYHVDHLEPLSRGGSNGPENLALTCSSCNLRKGTKDPMNFLERMCAS